MLGCLHKMPPWFPNRKKSVKGDGEGKTQRPWWISEFGLGLTSASPEEAFRVRNGCPLAQNEAVESWETAMSLGETPEGHPTCLNSRQDQMRH